MKFHQLAIGARFRFRDQTYCKISPLRGALDDDTQRLIPRSADVVPVHADGKPVANTPPGQLSWETVEQALGDLVAACERATKRTDPPLDPAQRAQLLRDMAHARQDLLDSLATRK